MSTTQPAAAHPGMDLPDEVILLTEDGQPCGTAPRADVHTDRTPLHLAFSCYLFGPDGRVLVSRRALSKKTWAGVWTNSFCGHPRPGEEVMEAIHRHAWHELGMKVEQIEPLLPDFRYRAVDASGVVENEICPVFTARTADLPQANPDEVAEWDWVTPDQLEAAVAAAPWALSPWMVSQMGQIGSLPRR